MGSSAHWLLTIPWLHWHGAGIADLVSFDSDGAIPGWQPCVRPPVRRSALGTRQGGSIVALSRVGATIIAAAVCIFVGSAAAQTLFGNDPFTNPSPKGLPAESGYNYSLSPFGGYSDLGGAGGGTTGTGGARASFAMPLEHSLGFLGSAEGGTSGGSGYAAGSAFLYWRDPAFGLVGPSAGVLYTGLAGGATIGFETLNAQAYVGRFTPFASGGLVQLDRFGTFGTVRTGLAFYPIDDLSLVATYSNLAGSNSYGGRLEYQFSRPVGEAAASLFVSGGASDRNASFVVAGVTLKLGRGKAYKSLVRRDREDDYWFQDNLNDDVHLLMGLAAPPVGYHQVSNSQLPKCVSQQPIVNCTCQIPKPPPNQNICSLP